jgi:quercetin dioxygenase-like cupin family protein
MDTAQKTRLWQQLLQRLHAVTPTHLTRRQQDGMWWPLQPGIDIKVLYQNRRNNSRSFLMRLAPGACYESHFHQQEEECLVLEGSVRIGSHTVHAGDYHLAFAGSTHDNLCSDTGALLFLRSSVSNTEPTLRQKLAMLFRLWFR